MGLNQHTLTNGSILGGYELLELIGKGGMGSVYRAKSQSGQIVAVKVLAADHVANDVLRTRFYLEAKLAMSIDHPNIVRAIEVGEDGGRHYLAMEYVQGESLNKRILREGKLSEADAIRCTVAVARALQKAHGEGLIHRDVKPDNILVTADGTVKLTDLGLAKKADTDLDLTRPGRGLGTPHFMAPEQFKNAKSVDAKTDIYALGASLYVMVTGKVPFRGEGPLDTFVKKSKNQYTPAEQVVPGLGKRVVKVIASCMSADPLQRPASAADIADYLEGKTRTLKLGEPVEEMVAVDEPTWFVQFRDADGKPGRIRGPESTIKRTIARGGVPADALASKHKRGPFRPIGQVPEFQALIATTTLETPNFQDSSKAAARSGVRRWAAPPPRRLIDHRVFAITLVVGTVVLIGFAWYLLVKL